MSKPPTKFGQLKVKGLSGESSANKGKTSVTSRGLNIKQGVASGVKKKSVNSNAVKGKSVVTKNSKAASPTPGSTGSSYQTNKARTMTSGQVAGATKSKGTTPLNLTGMANSPLNAVKKAKGALTKAGTLKKRNQQTNHLPGSPLKAVKGHARTDAKKSPINKYGLNGSFSPLS